MRRNAIVALLAAMALSAPALAKEPAPQVSAGDFVKAIQAAPAPPSGPAKPSKTGHCKPGLVEGDDGVCASVASVRGFSLATSGPSAHGTGHQKPGMRMASASQRSMAPPRNSRLSDLLIGFQLGSSELTDQGRANASAFAAALRNASVASTRFEIAGHTDASGTVQRNQELSQARADAVKSFLVTQGVDGSRLEAKGYGSTDLADPGKPNAATNRRVEARRLN